MLFQVLLIKILARFVDKIAVGYKRALSYFPENKVVFTGNPIRDDILLSTRNEGLMEFSLDTTKKNYFSIWWKSWCAQH